MIDPTLSITAVSEESISVELEIPLLSFHEALTDRQRLDFVRRFICETTDPNFIKELRELVNWEGWV